MPNAPQDCYRKHPTVAGLCKRKRSPRPVNEKPAMDYQLVMKTVRVHLFKQIHRQANRWIGESARALKRGMKSLERCPKRMCPNRNVRIHNGPLKRSESKPLEWCSIAGAPGSILEESSRRMRGLLLWTEEKIEMIKIMSKMNS